MRAVPQLVDLAVDRLWIRKAYPPGDQTGERREDLGSTVPCWLTAQTIQDNRQEPGPNKSEAKGVQGPTSDAKRKNGTLEMPRLVSH